MLVIQDPTDAQSTYLLESLLDSFRSATKIAGAFSFASAAGVRLVAEDRAFQEAAQHYPVELVIGVDGVTNEAALYSLSALAQAFPNVQVRAFLNPRPEALYHPKFCWTKTANGGRLITGSGNLTEGGLLRNWEAYAVDELNAEEVLAVESSWNIWIVRHDASLVSLDNEEVRRLARANNVLAREGDLPTLVAPAALTVAGTEPVTTLQIASTAAVLIAEIPQSGNRWKQANFHLDDYLNFFGARGNRLVVFRHVNADGTMGDYERERPPVTVRSRNFRFELAAATGIPYPTNGRPIGVFIRVGTRTFFYRLMLPSDAEYVTVSSLLERRAGGPARHMRSVRMTVDDLRREWPTSPFWQLPSTV
ncbi:MAG TPA: phospholipase D family protein [Pyrinomonadaceae bacterium]|nr:phospholipase D family protein [Pyrinomonadaceae bacterium]